MFLFSIDYIIMYQVDTIQLKRPFGYRFADQQDFLEAQIIAQKNQ